MRAGHRSWEVRCRRHGRSGEDVIAHTDLGLDEQAHPGINGPMRFRPETAKPLNDLTEALLRAPYPSLTPGERVLIAAYVSGLNECGFCCASHSAFAAAQLPAATHVVRSGYTAS